MKWSPTRPFFKLVFEWYTYFILVCDVCAFCLKKIYIEIALLLICGCKLNLRMVVLMRKDELEWKLLGMGGNGCCCGCQCLQMKGAMETVRLDREDKWKVYEWKGL